MVLSSKLTGLKSEVPLADYTTIRLGGNASHFISCKSTDDVRSALEFARSEGLKVAVIGGGSNVIFRDSGFNGLVMRIELKGVRLDDDGNSSIASVGAGEVWDEFVAGCVRKGLAGIECLSGIPGFAGATPIQNVGAYGQEVRDVIGRVKVMDRETYELSEFTASECGFGYRKSRFKTTDRDRFIVVEVAYRLRKSGRPVINYAELRDYIESKRHPRKDGGPAEVLTEVRDAVLALRKRKSMVVDRSDPNSVSVGSFFVNPVLSDTENSAFVERLKSRGMGRAPSFKSAEGTKIPAAWLVENAGFRKGFRKGGVGISMNHALALVNYSGTSDEILSLASEIEEAVHREFGIRLEREAVVI